MRGAIPVLILGLLCGLSCRADELDEILVKLSSKETSTRSAGTSALKRIINAGHLLRLTTYYKTAEILGCYPVVQAIEQKLPKATATAALRALVQTRVDYGSVYAAMALQRLGDSWGAELMIKLVDDVETPRARRLNIITYLTNFGDAGRRKLAELAARRTETPEICAKALDRLSYTTKGPGEEKILPAYEQPAPTDPKVIIALRLYKYSRADLDVGEALEKDALTGKLDSQQEYRFVYLVWQLAGKKKVDKARKEVLEHLAKKGKSSSVKIYALKALAKIGQLASAGRIAGKYRKLTEKKDAYLKREARKIWLDARGQASIAELKKELAKGTLEERVEVAELLLQRDIEEGAAVVLEALDASSPVEARRVAARAAALVGTRQVTRILVKLLDDADDQVRRNAYSAFSTLVRKLLPYRYVDWAKVGYNGDAAPAERTAAVAKLIAWLDQVLPKKKTD